MWAAPLYRLAPAAPGGQNPPLPAEEGTGPHGHLPGHDQDRHRRGLKRLSLGRGLRGSGVTEGDQEGISSGTSGTERKPMKSRSGSGRAQLCSAPAPRPSAAGPCVGPEATDARCPASRGAPTRHLRQRVRGGRADWPTQRWLAQRGAPAPGRAGLWSSSFTGAREDVVGPGRLRAPLIHGLLKLNILWKAVDCEDCVSFAHQSFQMLLGPCSTCCREGRGRRGHPDASGAEGASDRKLLPASDGSFRFRAPEQRPREARGR